MYKWMPILCKDRRQTSVRTSLDLNWESKTCKLKGLFNIETSVV